MCIRDSYGTRVDGRNRGTPKTVRENYIASLKVTEPGRDATYYELQWRKQQTIVEAQRIEQKKKDLMKVKNVNLMEAADFLALDFLNGKRVLVDDIISIRRRAPFTSFEDMRNRVKGIGPVTRDIADVVCMSRSIMVTTPGTRGPRFGKQESSRTDCDIKRR